MNLNTFKEYLKLHLISLEQDSEDINNQMDRLVDLDSDEFKDLEVMDISIGGQIIATAHLLGVLDEH